MHRRKSVRRWLQFSLRSVLLLTLAVALWLGYEVRQARHVERTVAALRALGGNAECEPTGWSLLRLCRVPGYGQRIVRVELPGSVVDESVQSLRELSALQEVQVTYDGTNDPNPSWNALHHHLSQATIVPRPDVRLAGIAPNGRIFDELLLRLRAKVRPSQLGAGDFMEELQEMEYSRRSEGLQVGSFQYHPLCLADGALAELIVFESCRPCGTGDKTLFAVLLADERVAAKRVYGARLEDLDADGMPELCVDRNADFWARGKARQLSGDPRHWLGVYKIERDGFKSLLPEDKSDYP